MVDQKLSTTASLRAPSRSLRSIGLYLDRRLCVNNVGVLGSMHAV